MLERGKQRPSARRIFYNSKSVSWTSRSDRTDCTCPLLLHLLTSGRGTQRHTEPHTAARQESSTLKRWRLPPSPHLYLLDSMRKIILFRILISTCHTQTKSYSRSEIPHQHASISVCIRLTSVFIIASCSLPSEMGASVAAYFTRLHNQCKHFET